MRHVNFFEVIALNVEIYCPFEERSGIINILVTGDNLLHRRCISLQKMKVSFLSAILRHLLVAPSLLFGPNLLFHPLAYILK